MSNIQKALDNEIGDKNTLVKPSLQLCHKHIHYLQKFPPTLCFISFY